MTTRYQQAVADRFSETADNFRVLAGQAALIAEIGLAITDRMRNGGMTYFCGNGGSAADSQHLAAELQGKFLHDRRPLAAMALTTNSSTLTAIGNDYGYEHVFERQVQGLCKAGDVLIGLSTSGNSANVIRALEAASELNVYTLALVGANGGGMTKVSDACILAPSTHTARIQEMHIAIGHMLCEIVEEELM